MPVRVNFLSRAQKLLRLPASSSHFHGTLATSRLSANKVVLFTYAREKGRFYSSSINQASDDQKNSPRNNESIPTTAKSKQHDGHPSLRSPGFKLLSDVYVAGGSIPQSANYELRQDGSMQPWGSWGIPIQWRDVANKIMTSKKHLDASL